MYGFLYLCIIFLLLVSARRSAYERHERVGKFFTPLCVFAIFVWSLYALVWGLGEEYQLFNVDTEIILFAIVMLSVIILTDCSSIFWRKVFLELGY